MSSNSYHIRSIPVSASTIETNKPFQLVPWTGDTNPSDPPAWMVSTGICYSTFNYDPATYVPIQGINEKIYSLTEKTKVYITFDVSPALQITGAYIWDKELPDPDAPEYRWPEYPQQYQIRPHDIWKDGKITTLVDGKRQHRFFTLIGYCTDDMDIEGTTIRNGTDEPFKYVQCLNTNLFITHSMVSGVPIAAAIPWDSTITYLKYPET